jgi:hypothetical protein
VVVICGFLVDVICVLYFCVQQFWCVNPLAGTPSHFYHGQVKTGVRGSCEVWIGVVVACGL